ncbi:MAG: hypothetical protein PHH11_07360 [Methylomonas sp.]|nr:hypothetical protein [Methylomonas sp.]
MKTRSLEEWTRLFTKLGVNDPKQWAEAEVGENLGNLPKAAFLRQVWNEIPGTDDGAWVEAWMKMARRQPDEAHIVAIYERMLAMGIANEDLALLLRGVMSQFLHRIAYLLDDASLTDEDLRENISWGFYEEDTEFEEPIRRLGCLHELVFQLDPEYKDD